MIINVMPAESTEWLSVEEVAELTGRRSADGQARWLTRNGWRFETSSGRKIILGRLYVRMRLCGLDLSEAKMSIDDHGWNLEIVN